jgi:hypothetical protein
MLAFGAARGKFATHNSRGAIMKNLVFTAALPVILLAGCGKSEVDLKNASVEDVVKATANAQALNPGQWSMTAKVVSVDMPGLPGQAKAMQDKMSQALIGRETVSENCVTPELAKNPSAEMFAGGAGSDCKFDKYAMVDGKMDARLVCKVPGGGEMKMSMAGPFKGDNFALDTAMEMGGPAAGGKVMTIKTQMTGKRTGECKAAGATADGATQ